jgi:uncharacterized protein (UPF0333 family)
MPKLGGMAQLSRPFQIALAGVLVLAGVSFFVLYGRSSSTSGSGSTPAATASAPATAKPASAAASAGSASTVAKAKAAAKSGHIYHGPVPGLEGLTRDIARAHGAVKAIGASPSSSASSSATHASASAPATTSSSVSTKHSTSSAATHQSASTSVPAATTVKQQPIKAQSGAGRTPARQVLVERALNEGKIAVILFWNPKGADDAIVDYELRLLEAVHHLIRPLAHTPQLRRQLAASGLELEKRFAAFTSPASQVATYGSITRGVQVYQTPTLLIVNKRGQTTVLTGLQDALSIEQAIDEARDS